MASFRKEALQESESGESCVQLSPDRLLGASTSPTGLRTEQQSAFHRSSSTIGVWSEGFSWPRGVLSDLATDEAGRRFRRQQEVVDADPSIVLECLAEVVPKGELTAFSRMQ
ncbi:MAG: hypothetical protein QOH85_131 [Acidobacteriaceae bacterium]|nr:hypothetical protein [Acidobacteriaceae bacterium]